MQDADLLVQLAGIAGVFVGFGALISVRSGGASGAHEVAYIGWVVSVAIWVVIVALAPVIISRYGIAGHELWLAGSLLALVLFVVIITVNGSAPEMREDRALVSASRPPLVVAAVVAGSTIWLPTAALVLALVLVALGPFPDQESALYLTAVGLGLYMGAIGLFVIGLLTGPSADRLRWFPVRRSTGPSASGACRPRSARWPTAGPGAPPTPGRWRHAGRPPCAEVATMPDTELFLSLAEIAGVFVGFGALIALRSSGPGDMYDLLMIGMVVWIAIAVVIIAIAPVAVSGFGITGHALWLACSVIALLVFFAGDEVVTRASRERRAFIAEAPMRRRWKGELAVGAVTWIPAIVALGLVILGVLPEQEAALYFLAAALFLLLSAILLLMIVFGVQLSAWGLTRNGEGANATPAATPPGGRST